MFKKYTPTHLIDQITLKVVFSLHYPSFSISISFIISFFSNLNLVINSSQVHLLFIFFNGDSFKNVLETRICWTLTRAKKIERKKKEGSNHILLPWVSDWFVLITWVWFKKVYFVFSCCSKVQKKFSLEAQNTNVD